MADENNPLTRRRAIGLSGRASWGLRVWRPTCLDRRPQCEKGLMMPHRTRLLRSSRSPTLPHGGGPHPSELGRQGWRCRPWPTIGRPWARTSVTPPARSLRRRTAAPVPTVMTAAQLPMPTTITASARSLSTGLASPWRPRGRGARNPRIAGKVGITASATDDSRGFDHGTFRR